MAVLELLRSRAQPLDVIEVAQHVGLHKNTVRPHLDLLVDSGYAIRHSAPPNGPGRPRVVYEAVAAPDGERNFRLLAEVLAQHIVATSECPGEAAVNVGRSWAGLTEGRGHSGNGADAGAAPAPQISEEAAIAAVVRMLGDIDFAPEVSADGTAINLRRCPFRELALTNPEAVCEAHLAMIQGALAELGAPVSATRLLPLVQPDLCVTTITRSATATERNDPAATRAHPRSVAWPRRSRWR
jgi:predicted ArsR family transcriptional regulator